MARQIIDVIAPARANFSMTSDQIKAVISDYGFKARFPSDMVQKGVDLLCCNSIETRTEYLIEALTNKSSKIIWALAGGYGTTQLLPALDGIDFSNNKKLIVGFSDITALSIYMMQKHKWPCVHARNIRGIVEGKGTDAEKSLLQGVFVNKYADFAYSLSPFNEQATQEKKLSSECMGTNLALVQCSLGTNWHIKTKGKILLLEDIDEPGYRVDRMLVHLDQAGVFDGVKALILGDFSCGKESELVQKVLKRFFAAKEFPVCKTDKFGHGKHNYPMPLGVKSTLSLGKDCKISFNSELL